MNNPVTARRCPACRQAELQPATWTRDFRPHGHEVRVELLTSRCPACGAEATSASQHAENLARLQARKAQYRGLLLGEEILGLRRRYGITQQQAAKIFGKGKIAFSRYENEASYPDVSTTDLLELAIQKPDVIKALADKKGVALPLWDVRCADERKEKLRVVHSVAPVDLHVLSLVKKILSGESRRSQQDTIWDKHPVNTWKADISSNDEQYDPMESAMA